MPISVQCPGCGRKLKGKDELAGKRVKCPSCGESILIPASEDPPATAADQPASLIDAALDGDAQEIARLMLDHEFTLVSTSQDSAGYSALTAEIDDFDALVAFTSMDYARQFADEMPDQLDDEGNLPGIVVDGRALLGYLPKGSGLLLNPESADSVVLPPDLVAEIKLAASSLGAPAAPRQPSDSADGKQAESLRREVLAFLEARGFQPARWLPLPDLHRNLRSESEIAARFMALGALVAWASAPEEVFASQLVQGYVAKNRLRSWLTGEEATILALPRDEAREAHSGNIGWRLENMWPLVWVLGFDAEPTIEASQIDPAISRAMIFDFLDGLNGTVDHLLQKTALRPREEVIALEDRFYCAHNAVRSAQLGEKTVPRGFDPIAHGGAVHERRHSLTWCLSPGTAWDDTDLST